MKKLVLLLTLFFAISMQANTIKEKQNLKLDVKKVEMPEKAGGYKCTSTAHTYTSDDGNGGFYQVTVVVTHCVPVE